MSELGMRRWATAPDADAAYFLPARRAFVRARATTTMFAAITANNVQKRMGSPMCSLRHPLLFETLGRPYLSLRMVEPIG